MLDAAQLVRVHEQVPRARVQIFHGWCPAGGRGGVAEQFLFGAEAGVIWRRFGGRFGCSHACRRLGARNNGFMQRAGHRETAPVSEGGFVQHREMVDVRVERVRANHVQ